MSTSLAVEKTTLQRILPLRALFLQEANHQIRHDARHGRGWTDSWLLAVDGRPVGYGAVMGSEDFDARDTLFELYVMPPFRRHARTLCTMLLAESGVARIECQSNDALLASLLHEFARDVNADTILFEHDAIATLELPGATFRPRAKRDRIFEHTMEPVGDFVVERDGEVVGTGGFLLHYNPPFADLYMEVAPAHRRRGVGGFLIQGLIRECFLAGRVPAARTSLDNVASRMTLTRGGLRLCGFMIAGRVPRG